MAIDIRLRFQNDECGYDETITLAFTPINSGYHLEPMDLNTTGDYIYLPANVNELGMAVFINADDTNSIEIGSWEASVGFTGIDLIRPGRFRVGELNPDVAGTLYARAKTGTAKLKIAIFEE
jgi:hypothetical protein